VLEGLANSDEEDIGKGTVKVLMKVLGENANVFDHYNYDEA
jgi:hypothetical protein